MGRLIVVLALVVAVIAGFAYQNSLLEQAKAESVSLRAEIVSLEGELEHATLQWHNFQQLWQESADASLALAGEINTLNAEVAKLEFSNTLRDFAIRTQQMWMNWQSMFNKALVAELAETRAELSEASDTLDSLRAILAGE